jgi:predicted O-methyltransferase YrrM
MALDSEFFKRVVSLHGGMGTEKMAPLLYSLICFNRPRSLLEIGAGYTTPFMAQALLDTVRDWRHEKQLSGIANFVEDHYAREYSPRMLCIDNDTHPGSTSSKVQPILSEMGLDGFIEFVDADFRDYWQRIDKSRLPFDFVWFDCGEMPEYHFFFRQYWQFLNPNGGLLLMHSTLTNLHINTFIKSVKLLQATTDFANLELLSMLEPNKKRQNSVTLFRKTSGHQETIYSITP